ncbi:MAG: UvrD-helicase domain-containing protein [Candidatus Zapsychrus exili]|nr:UvrD-helicase domain-containing protein [Candidatus Zapsychrus exili]
MTKNKTIFKSPEVRVVEASAGSGKTYALAKRYLQLLFNPNIQSEHIPIRNILAITFTNKAAFEMKGRILEFLKLIALGKLSATDEREILSSIGINKQEAKERALIIMEDLIHHYNFFGVQTIDKFINALLSGCAFKVGLTANFKIRTNSAQQFHYSLDKLIDYAHTDKDIAQIFEEFLHNYLYLENRSGWFPKDDMLSIVHDLFRQNNTYGHDFKKGKFESGDLIKKKIKILKKINDLAIILPKETDARFTKSLNKFLSNTKKSFDIDSVSNYFAREVFPAKAKTEISKEVETLWSSIHKNLKELCVGESQSLFNLYVGIFDQVKDIFKELSCSEDVLFLEELNKKCELLFGEGHITVAELYYRLATRFRHYLIDEFQDTSALQWDNLKEMIEEALSTGGTLFYVGDKKQAIYGFRGGDVELFDKIKQDFNQFNVGLERLTDNYRSKKAVVEFNNSIFSIENLKSFVSLKQDYENKKKKATRVIFEESDFVEVENIFGSAQQEVKRGGDGYVKVEYVDIDKKEERDEVTRDKIISLVADLKKRFSYSDIAVLTRNNSQVESVTNWLLGENIPVESERTSNVRDSHLIEELISFLKFLDSPIDNISFVNFILGDIFSVGTGVAKEEMHKFVFSLRQKIESEKDLYVYMEFRDAYPDIWKNYLEEFFKNVGLYPLYEMVASILGKFKVLNNFSEYQGFLMHFLNLIKAQEEQYSDILSFIDYFDNLEGDSLYVNVKGKDAIKVLTVHKAKGLEFGVVILPFLGIDVQVGSNSSDNKQSYVLRNDGSSISLIKLKEKYYKFSDELYQIYKEQYLKAFLSELNNIYVATTRSKEELYAFIPKKVGNSFNLLKFLIPESAYEMGKKDKAETKEKKDVSLVNIPASEHCDWIHFLKEEFVCIDQLRNRDKRIKGEALHFALSLIGDLNKEDVSKNLDLLFEDLAFRFGKKVDIEQIKSKVEDILKDATLKKFFYLDDAEAFNEKDIVDKNGFTKRIDRLIVSRDTITILDYKLSEPSDSKEYVNQVKTYMDILKDIYPKQEVKGYLLYLDKLSLEEING